MLALGVPFHTKRWWSGIGSQVKGRVMHWTGGRTSDDTATRGSPYQRRLREPIVGV